MRAISAAIIVGRADEWVGAGIGAEERLAGRAREAVLEGTPQLLEAGGDVPSYA
jgi:hypothetical protein